MPIQVSSVDDPRLDDYRNIPDPELIRRRGLFIAEGRLVVRRLIESSRFTPKSLLLTSAALDDFGDLVARVTVPIFVVEQDGMDKVAGFHFHRGCLAVGVRPQPASWRDIVTDGRPSTRPTTLERAGSVVVVEQITNADNMGSIFRNAAAFGAHAVLLDPTCVDPLYRKAIRTSMGTALQIPFATMTVWPADLDALRAMGFTLVALTPAADASPLSEAFPDRDARVALLVGHEGAGLSEQAFRYADVRARIPMPGGIDSLNVATATAIAMYEMVRPALGSRL